MSGKYSVYIWPFIAVSHLAGKSALLVGATGATGRYVLKELLASQQFTRVGEYGRRTTPLDQITAGKEKLEQKTIDFKKLENSGLKDGKWDVVFITFDSIRFLSDNQTNIVDRLGTTRANAGSAAAFEKIDREYVINAARAAKSDSSQRLVYLSVSIAIFFTVHTFTQQLQSAGASASSSFLYPRFVFTIFDWISLTVVGKKEQRPY